MVAADGDGVAVVQWAQEHGEVGGVLASHSQLTRLLRAEGRTVRYVDTGSAARAVRQVPRELGAPRALHLFHITRLWRAMVLAPLFAALRGRTVLVLHSGSVARQLDAMGPVQSRLLRLALPAYDEVWAVNDEISAKLPARLSRRVRVVTPFAAEGPDSAAPQRDPHAVSLATNAGLPHYNADLAVEAIRLVRQEWPDARLRVLAYGHDGEHLARLRATVAEEPWVDLSFDASAGEVSAVLHRSGVFLRPTSWDGDSVVVREALAAGCRVVATRTAPRPAGVELADLDAGSIAQAVLHGGPSSSGVGLATETLLEAAHAAMNAMSSPRPNP
jgi:glycosyltransferase involved in cell wall biosynthesis